MNTPDNAITIASGTVWMDEGIVIHRANSNRRTGETVNELFGIIRDLFGGKPGPVLFDARDWSGSDPEAWLAATHSLLSTVTKGAMLIDPESPGEIGPFPEAISRTIPFVVFTDEVKALAFLRT